MLLRLSIHNFESLTFDDDGVFCYMSSPNSNLKIADKSHPSTETPILSRLVPAKYHMQFMIAAHEASGHRFKVF